MKRHFAPGLAAGGIAGLLIACVLLVIGGHPTQTAFGSTSAVAPVIGVTTAAEPTPEVNLPARPLEPPVAPTLTPTSRSFAALLPADDKSVVPHPSISSALAVAPPVQASAGVATPEVPVRLKIASIGLDTKVVSTGVVGGVWQVADFAAGYMAGTGFPGQPGNMAIAGHDDIQGEVFRHLKSVSMGDSIALNTANHQYQYVVDAIRYVHPDDVSVIDPSQDARLTLITCWPDFSTSKASYNSLRLIVEAKLAV